MLRVGTLVRGVADWLGPPEVVVRRAGDGWRITFQGVPLATSGAGMVSQDVSHGK